MASAIGGFFTGSRGGGYKLLSDRESRRKEYAERRLTIDNIKSFLEPDTNLELLVEDGDSKNTKLFKVPFAKHQRT